jgi:hypothetical protein
MRTVLSIAMILLLADAVFAQSNTINAIIGDVSFVQRFQQAPEYSTNEVLRIQTHLQYVEDLLRQKSTAYLKKKQRQKRKLVLDLLHHYWENGVFPKNYDYPGRRPCFIDCDGNICAVGYLIEQTTGREVAEKINAKHKYDYLPDMHEKLIDEWAKEYGLTLEECAMIQPTYGYIPTDQTYTIPVKTGYGISSGFLGGVNLGVNMINLSNRNLGRSKTLGYMGLISGTSQIVLGLSNIRKDEVEGSINGPSRTMSYRQQNNLSYINIAAGTTTVLTSAFNLILNKHTKDKRNALNLYSYPDINNKMVAGLAFTRSL